MQIVDREKLLKGPKEPTPDNLRHPLVGRLDLSPIGRRAHHIPARQDGDPGIRQGQGRKRAQHGHDRQRGQRSTNARRQARQMVFFVDATIESRPMIVSQLGRAGGERQFLLARRPLRRAFLEREHGAGFLQEAGLHHLVQRRPARARHPQSLRAEGGRLFHSRRSPKLPKSAASRWTARTAARSRSRATTRKPTTAAMFTLSIAPIPACTSWN